MDTNVVGRKFYDHHAAEDEYPKIKRIAVRALTDESNGNATGIGLAEFCRSQVLRQMDRRATHINCLAANHPTGAMIPIDFDNDRDMLAAALATIGWTEPTRARMVWIRNTLKIQSLACSAEMADEIADRDDIEVCGDPRPLNFTAAGLLSDVDRF